jgi:hypothetical protein
MAAPVIGRTFRINLLAALTLSCANVAHSDGDVIDRIYDPYVRELERELEYGTLYQRDVDDDRTGLQWQRFSYGQAFNERWAGEVYAISRPGGNGVDAVEFEAKRQLTEQGEYAIDWGMLMEVERCFACNSWEGSVVVLAEHDWARWVAVANLGLVYEWGGGIKSEFESRLAAQLRYRWSQSIEPGLELFSGEDTRAVGPALAGALRLGPGRGLRWNAAVVFGVDGATADTTAKVNIEYEF